MSINYINWENILKKSYGRKGAGRGGGGGHECIAIAINLPIVLAEIVIFVTDNRFHTFAPLPPDDILATRLYTG